MLFRLGSVNPIIGLVTKIGEVCKADEDSCTIYMDCGYVDAV